MSTKFNTSLTRLLSIRSPIICPPMSGAAGGLLASQVTAAGGFGFMAPTYTTMADFSSQFDIARKTLGISSGPLPIGVGFLGFRLEKTDNEFTRQLLEHALEQQVHAVWLAFGNDLGTWVDYVRNYDAKREHKTLIFIGVSSVSAAVQAASEFKADAIAAQSSDAGGHGMSTAPGTLTLVTSILDALPKESSPPIIAAGGITRPNQVAAMLTLGAAGTAHGTMFLATPASLYKEESKQAIIAADGESTVRSYGFDLLRGTTGWPKGVDGRGIAIKSVQELEGMQQDTTPEGVDLEAMRQGMDKRGEKIVWAGSGVGAIKEIREAADIVRDMHEGTVAVLKNAGSLIVS